MMRNGESIGIYFLITLFFISVGTASAADITVNNSTGPMADFTSIQAAVDAATDGDTIIVYNGTYIENVDVNKELNITSQSGNPEDTVVQALDENDYVFYVTANNVTISGFKVDGSHSWGIYLDGVRHNNISSNEISKNWNGIFLNSSGQNKLNNNNIDNNLVGISLKYSDSNLLSNNSVHNTNEFCISLDYSHNNTLLGNSIGENTDHGIILSDSNNNTLNDNEGYQNVDDTIYLVNSNNNTLSNNTAKSGFAGFYLHGSSNNTLNNNYAEFVEEPIRMFNSSNNVLSNNYAGGDYPSRIFLRHSDNNTLTGNGENVGSGGFCIALENSNNNTLNGNSANKSSYSPGGFYLESSSGNILTNNTANQNENFGIYLNNSGDNLIYNNYFNNTDNAYDNGNNTWNITKTEGINIVGGPFLGGNYWSDYAGADTDGDGLGDTLLPYNSDGQIANGGDYLPLVIPAGPIPPIQATVDIHPGVLNPKSKGEWITAYIELPEGYDVNDIEMSTIMLMGSIPAESFPSGAGDYDKDGKPDLMVKFDRKELISLIGTGDVELTVTGELTDGTIFEGTDTIWVLIKVK